MSNNRQLTKTEEALINLMGLYDTPIERRRKQGDESYFEAIMLGRDAIKNIKKKKSVSSPRGLMTEPFGLSDYMNSKD